MGVIFDFVGPPYHDAKGLFLSPEHAATHAVLVQRGFSTPEEEARRMTKSTSPFERQMGLDWLERAANPYRITDHRYKPGRVVTRFYPRGKDKGIVHRVCAVCGQPSKDHANAGSRIPK